MEQVTAVEIHELTHDLGMFEGFNFRDQAAIFPNHSAEDVVRWDHDMKGEAEFWPAGDHEGVSLLFKGRSSVCGSELVHLDRLLDDLGDDSVETYVRLHYLIASQGQSLEQLTTEAVGDLCCHVFSSASFLDLRKEAALELFEVYYPEEYVVWERSLCDGLIFDENLFLDSPIFDTLEVTLGEYRFLLACPN